MGTAEHKGGQTTDVGHVIVGYRDGVTVLGLVGEHDASTANELARSISHCARRSSGIVVSFSETDFVDSTIIRALLLGDRTMVSRGQRLVVHVDGSMICDRILELAGAHQHLLCCDSLDAAITHAAQHDHTIA